MVEISVIIPVYNAQEYLSKSLDSIVNQTFDDIEIICVNDGSVDGSLAILEDYASKYDFISIYSQENKGGGAARNFAIKQAIGKYIYFMDADDILKHNALEDTYKIAEEKNLDFLIFTAINYDDALEKYYETRLYRMVSIANAVGGTVFNYKDLGDLIFDICVTPWCKLYNRQFVLKSKAQFAEGLIFHDNIFFWPILFNAERVYFHNECLYVRRRHKNSSTGSGDKRFLNSVIIVNKIWDIFSDFNLFGKYDKKLYEYKIKTFKLRFNGIQSQYEPLFFDAIKEDFTNIKNNGEFFKDFYDKLSKEHKEFFDWVINSENSNELSLLLENKRLKNKNKSLFNDVKNLQKKNKSLKLKNKKLKSKQKKILSSNSWKLTKPLRIIGGKLR